MVTLSMPRSSLYILLFFFSFNTYSSEIKTIVEGAGKAFRHGEAISEGQPISEGQSVSDEKSIGNETSEVKQNNEEAKWEIVNNPYLSLCHEFRDYLNRKPVDHNYNKFGLHEDKQFKHFRLVEMTPASLSDYESVILQHSDYYPPPNPSGKEILTDLMGSDAQFYTYRADVNHDEKKESVLFYYRNFKNTELYVKAHFILNGCELLNYFDMPKKIINVSFYGEPFYYKGRYYLFKYSLRSVGVMEPKLPKRKSVGIDAYPLVCHIEIKGEVKS